MDEIQFDIGNGAQRIQIGANSALPVVTRPLVINGAARPAGRPTQQILLDGTALTPGSGNGIDFGRGSDHSRLWGLSFTNFRATAAIVSNATDVHIGGAGENQGNAFYGNDVGISIGRLVESDVPLFPPLPGNPPVFAPMAVGVADVHIVGNPIGTSTRSVAEGGVNGANVAGIEVWGSGDVTIGGAAESERNVIVLNKRGIGVYGSDGATVFNNYIGTIDGSVEAGNIVGVAVGHHTSPAYEGGYLQSKNITIGGDAGVAAGVIVSAANVISGSTGSGIEIDGSADGQARPMPGTSVVGNFVGVMADGVTPMGNETGVSISHVAGSPVYVGSRGVWDERRNVISGNSVDGVRLIDVTQAVVRYNIIGVGADSTTACPNGEWGVYDMSVRIPGDPTPYHSSSFALNLISGNLGGNLRLAAPGAYVAENTIRAAGAKAGVLVEAPGIDLQENTITDNVDVGILVDLTQITGVPLDLTIGRNTIGHNCGSGLALFSETLLDKPDPD